MIEKLHFIMFLFFFSDSSEGRVRGGEKKEEIRIWTP
jgi:hypothetical protein